MTIVGGRESDYALFSQTITCPDDFAGQFIPADSRLPRSKGTRSAIMTAARKAFAINGLQETRLAAVARAAWVAPSTVSMHFKGKESLFAACLDEEIDWLFDGAVARVGGHPYPMLSGDFMRILSRRLNRYPLLTMSLATSPGKWGKNYYESPKIVEMEAAVLAELTRAQKAGFLRPEVILPESARAYTEIQAWSLWTATQQSIGFSHVERVIDMTKNTVLSANKIFELHEECRTWRTAASRVQRNGSVSLSDNRQSGGAQRTYQLRTP